MLKQRVITAIVLAALVMTCLFVDNPIFWRGLISAAIIVGFWEWLRFCDIKAPLEKALSYALFGASFYCLQAGFLDLSIIIPVMCLVWCTLLLFTLTSTLDFLHNKFIKLFIGVLVLCTSGVILIELKSLVSGHFWILCFMASVWAADVGAYFVGRRFGKTKLAPQVSPGKTVEGMFGGMAFMLVIYVPVLFYVLPVKSAALLLVALMVTTIVSVGGDLFESKMKRFSGLKDSSQILPGHGGVLDRIDSLLSGAPFFAMGLIALGYLG